MGLIDLKTNLKSLKYGNDKQGGGSSNQPYIVTPIPDGYAPKAQDFLLRDGRLNFLDSAQDVSRLTQFFADTKSPGGLLFTAKQLLLERQNPKMVNADRIYLPTSTISQAGVLSIGAHLNKQGLDPLAPGYFTEGLNSNGYFKATKNQELGPGRLENRLTIAYASKILNQPLGEFTFNPFGITGPEQGSNLLSYTGGPNSIGGFGKTNIRIQNPTIKSKDVIRPYAPIINWVYNPSIDNPGVSNQAIFDFGLEEKQDIFYPEGNVENVLNRDVASTGFLEPTPTQKILNSFSDVYVLTGQQIQDQSPNSGAGGSQDGKKNTLKDFRYESDLSADLPSTDYTRFNRETTYGTSVTEYKLNTKRIDPNATYNSDLLNIEDPQSAEAASDFYDKDLIRFYFEVLGYSGSEVLLFRAYINNLGDTFNADWQSYKYVGRAENFYRYSGFSRDISLSFTVYAHSRDEMLPIYKKLNYLAGTTSPSYSDAGFMRGNITKITVGDYLTDVPGIIRNVSLKPSFEGGWDINREIDGTPIPQDSNLYVGQLPRMIDVDMSITLIHNFTPQYQKIYAGNPDVI
jgi:hypothetical protein